MYDTMVVVTNSSQAKIYAMEDHKKPLYEMIELVDTKRRSPVKEHVSDYPGRTFVKTGQTFIRVPSVNNFKKVDVPEKRRGTNELAETIGNYIDSERINNKLGKLILISNPKLLELIRDKLSKSTQKLIKKEVNKDLMKLDEAEIRDYIYNYTCH